MSDIDEQEKVLAELVLASNDGDIKSCLRLYDPKSTTKKLVSELNKCSKNVIVATLEFLKVPNQTNYTKPICINKLICRIQNLFPDKCNMCNEIYRVSIGDTPLLCCSVCGQGAHSACLEKLFGLSSVEFQSLTPEKVYGLVNPMKIPGLQFLCGACETQLIPKPDISMQKKEVGGESANESVEVATEAEKSTVTEPKDVQDGPALSNGQTNHQVNNSSSESEVNGQIKETPVCPYYIRDMCRYGRKGKSCPRRHPTLCKKLLKYETKGSNGCNLGKKCTYYHPKMCTASINKNK